MGSATYCMKGNATPTSANIAHYYAAHLLRRGPHIASHSVCLSVRPVMGCRTVLRANIQNRKTSVFSLPSVTSRHLANYNDTHVRSAYRTAISAAQIIVFFLCRSFTIARQHAVHSERDIVLPILSVYLSVCLSNAGAVSKRMVISSHFFSFLIGALF